jgi:hypothetical protein
VSTHKQRYTRHAVAIMAEWLGDGAGETGRVSEMVTQIVRERDDGDVAAGLTEVVIGFINLTGQLLLHANDRTGVRGEELLREVARLAAAD